MPFSLCVAIHEIFVCYRLLLKRIIWVCSHLIYILPVIFISAPPQEKLSILVSFCLRVGLSQSKKNCVICLTESPFLSAFWSCRKNGLIRKIRLTSIFMAPQSGFQIIAIYILPNISQSKVNQTMKFGQIIEYNKRNIILKILCKKWGKETSSRPLFIF